MNRWTSERLRKIVKIHNAEPETIIDVGVGYGTPQLYDAFEDQELVLIEPLIDYDRYIKGILEKRRGRYVASAVGAVNDDIIMNIDKKYLQRSSVGCRLEMREADTRWEKRKVRLETLDTIMERENVGKPYGLKIDTEGHEIEVIKGARQVLKNTTFVISEISVVPRFVGGYSFVDFLKVMDEMCFRLMDILDINPKGDAPPPARIVDAIFIRK